MNKESNDIYYEVMMSDFITLGKGHYERGNNASVEELNYQRNGISAVGEMSLNDDHLTIKLQYSVEGIPETWAYFLECEGFELLSETIEFDNQQLDVRSDNDLSDSISINSAGKKLQFTKDESGVLLVAGE